VHSLTWNRPVVAVWQRTKRRTGRARVITSVALSHKACKRHEGLACETLLPRPCGAPPAPAGASWCR